MVRGPDDSSARGEFFLLGGEQQRDAGWTPTFRADDPLIYNHDTGQPTDANGFAISAAKLSGKVRFLRLKRMDSGQYVIVKMDSALLAENGRIEGDLWWCGGRMTRGAVEHRNRNVGIARRSWPTTGPSDQLIRRAAGKLDEGYRGWGFSKAATGKQDQTYSWDGKPIEKTIFEIAVKSEDLSHEEKSHLLSAELLERAKKPTRG